jgi:hypothetical protein
MKKIIPAALITLFLISCYRDNEEQLYPNAPCIDPPTTTFSSTVSGILLSYGCINCHNGSNLSGGVNLDGWANVRLKAIDKSLIGAISHSDGYKPMPYNLSKMSICDINRVQAWINAGAQNN